MAYTLIANSTSVTRDSDGATIPNDPRNCDWQAYQLWLAAGNTPNPAPPSQPTLVQSAMAALLKSGETNERIHDAVVLELNTWTSADVQAWATYRKALRAIVDGTSTATSLPTQPPYPVGT